MKYKILAFNDYYIPAVKCGGPVTSINNAVFALKDDFDFYIEAANHDFGDKTPFPNINDDWYMVGPAHVRYHKDGELDFNYKRIKLFIEEVNPDVLWFSGLLVPNKLHNAIRVAKKNNIPVIISPRGEASPDRMAIKAYKKIPYAFLVSLIGIYKKKNVFFHTTSDDEIIGLKKYFHIKENKIFEIPNIGVVSNSRIITYEKKVGEIRIMFISRIHEVKNLDYAINVVNALKCKAIFDIYGPIESPEYWNKCLELISKAPSNISINYCGKINPAEVREIYPKYDCFLFPTINENYGHVIAESLAYGCPVILSKGTTPWDDINDKAGFVCSLDDIDCFVASLNKIANMNNIEYSQFVSNVKKYYDNKTNDNDAVDGHRDMFLKVIKTIRIID